MSSRHGGCRVGTSGMMHGALGADGKGLRGTTGHLGCLAGSTQQWLAWAVNMYKMPSASC